MCQYAADSSLLALRLTIGASVLSAARVVDTRLVKERLARFEREHRRYVAAQGKVTAVDQRLRAVRARLSECDAVQDEAVEALAVALVGDGHRIRNPFAAFGAPAPSRVARLPFADEAEAVHRLVAAIQRNPPLSKRTAEAARAADEAARAVEHAIVGVKKVEATVRAARQMRDAIGHGWHSAYDALRHSARAAAIEGSPQFDAIVFRAPRRPAGKRRKPVGTTATVPEEVPGGPDERVT